MSPSKLGDLLSVRNNLARDIIDAGGEVDEHMSLVWEQANLDIKEKIDSYGYAMSRLENEKNILQELKERISAQTKTVERAVNNMKARLFTYADGKPLRGIIFNFLPYLTKRSRVNLDELEDKYKYVSVEMKLEDYKGIVERLQSDHKVIKYYAKVSEIPEGHPAVSFENEPSVRVT